MSQDIKINVEEAVRQRYSAGAQERQAALCCPVDYNQKYLEIIPAEIIERDYGCGDPSRYLRPGEVVLDLGSGGGKICYIAAQVVGPQGRVIGVDMNDDMLALARKYQEPMAAKLGFANVEFRKGRIQDLGLDLEKLDRLLGASPVHTASAYLQVEATAEELRRTEPLIPSESVDVVVSNCVLNLVDARAKSRLFSELFRVLKPGGRAVISDIVSDREVPLALQNDPVLWSGCISGAFEEEAFLEAFDQAGFYGIQLLKRDVQPWQTVQGIEFRSVTVEAFKGSSRTGLDRGQAVIYKGPFKSVIDETGRRLLRGARQAVDDVTFERYQQAPYCNHMETIETATLPDDGSQPTAPTPSKPYYQPMEALRFSATPPNPCGGEGGKCC